MKTKHPTYMMVFGAVFSDGEMKALLIFLRSLKLNTKAYIVPGGGSAALPAGRPNVWRQESVCVILHKQENPVLAMRKLLRPNYP